LAKAPQDTNSYLKYSGLGLQILLTIGIAGWLGYKLDVFLGWGFPVSMLVFGFAAFAGTLYQLYRTINKP
jgi:hypothetical protein